VQEQCLERFEEAKALVSYALKLNESFVAVSPFIAQCIQISRLSNRAGIDLRVYTPDQLGTKKFTGHPRLLISLVAEQCDPVFPYPLNDVSAIAPLLVGDYKSIEIFCSDAVVDHHPLLRILKDA
jgi:hypothetical protein